MPQTTQTWVELSPLRARPQVVGVLSRRFELFQRAGHLAYAIVHEREDGFRFELAVVLFFAGRAAREDLDALFDLGDRPNVEFSGADSFQNVFAEHQVFDVGFRHHHALRAGESLNPADVIKSFDLFVDAADGLNISLLIDGTSHGDVLPQRQSRQRGRQRINLRRTGAVAIHSGIRLFEADAGGQ